jgi:AcrR family transcriptional regulator
MQMGLPGSSRSLIIGCSATASGQHGYEATSIEAVLAESGVSRGSLYHHFDGKEELFRAVLTRVEEQMAVTLAEAARDVTDPVELLRVGCLTFIRLAGDRLVPRVMLIEAPAVLGWDECRERDEEHTLGAIRAALADAAVAGRLDPAQVDMFAHMLLAAMNEVALVIARSDDQAAAHAAGTAAVEEFLRRALGPPPG